MLWVSRGWRFHEGAAALQDIGEGDGAKLSERIDANGCYACVRACVRACVLACVFVVVCACVSACVCLHVRAFSCAFTGGERACTAASGVGSMRRTSLDP
eukprot:6214772-Pleurochrysis_carterae.AAC.10